MNISLYPQTSRHKWGLFPLWSLYLGTVISKQHRKEFFFKIECKNSYDFKSNDMLNMKNMTKLQKTTKCNFLRMI